MTRTLLHTRRGRLALIAGGLALVIGLVVWQAPDLDPISRAFSASMPSRSWTVAEYSAIERRRRPETATSSAASSGSIGSPSLSVPDSVSAPPVEPALAPF